MSMTKQLWAAIVASILLAMVGSLVTSLLNARGYLSAQLTQKNMDNANSLALSMTQGELDNVRVELAVAAIFDGGHYLTVQVTDPLGRVIVARKADSRVSGAPAWFEELLPIDATPGTAQISQGWKQFGTVLVESDSRFAYEALWRGALQMCVALAIAGLLAGYLGSLILRRLIPPLHQVVEQASGIAQRRFTTIPLPKVPELAQLAHAMNTMVVRLEAMFAMEAARVEEVRREANFDAVTGLANRGYFLGRVASCLGEEGTGGVLLLARIANLAAVNQRLGREATDALLRQVASAIQAKTDSTLEELAGRLGGADFALLLPGRVDADEIAKSVLDEILPVAPRYDLDPQQFVHIGAVVVRPGAEMSAALAQADAALAGAETSGQSSARVGRDADPSNPQPQSANQWDAVLKHAIEQRRAKLQPFPVVDAKGTAVHWECPLRLCLEENGEWQAAGRFLPIAERLGLTPELDLLAIGLALEMLEKELVGGQVAINLSPQSVSSDAFRAKLEALVSHHRPEARRLWLEIAESGAFLHLEEVGTLCKRLAPFGCRVGIEHFGLGFGQIGRLHHLGLSYLKVDAAFIRQIDSHEGNRAFLAGLRSISSAIGLQLIAEGVTTDAEVATLGQLGFDGVTGPGVRSA